MGTITIKLHYCSKEERNDLVEYLDGKCWDIEEVSDFKTKENEEIRSDKVHN
jgi:hypothetical protein